MPFHVEVATMLIWVSRHKTDHVLVSFTSSAVIAVGSHNHTISQRTWLFGQV